MSDPFRGEFGVGEIGGGLEGGGGEGLVETNNQLSKTEEVLISIANQLSGISKGLESFEGIAKKMGDSKVVKSTSNMAKMFKGIAGASPQAFLIEKLFNTLKPLLDLFKPFQVILDLISALLKVMVGEALGPMFEALQPLYDMFISMMPVFARLGGAIGNLIATLLRPLIDIFMALMPVIEPIIGIVIALINMAIEPLKAIFDAIMPIIVEVIGIFVELINMAIEPLMDIFDALMPVIMPIITVIMSLVTAALKPLMQIFKALMPFIMPLIELAFIPLKIILGIISPLLEALTPIFGMMGDIMGPLAPILDLVIGAIGFVAKGFIWFINVIIDSINLLMNVLTLGFWTDIAQIKYPGEGAGSAPLGGGSPGGGRLGGGARPGGGFQMAEGGIVSHGIYELGEGGSREAVIPLDQWEKSVSAQTALLGAMHDELMISNSLNRQILRTKEWKRVFR